MKTIYFVRHGECESNVKRLIAGSSDDSPLTPKGYEQAQDAATELQGKQIDLIVSSPLIRALETARRISDLIGYEGEFRKEPLLSERDFGVATGMPTAEGFKAIDSGEITDLETLEELADRQKLVLEFFRTLNAKYILAVGHSGAEQMLQTIYQGRPYDSFLETEHLKNGHFREYQLDSAI